MKHYQIMSQRKHLISKWGLINTLTRTMTSKGNNITQDNNTKKSTKTQKHSEDLSHILMLIMINKDLMTTNKPNSSGRM